MDNIEFLPIEDMIFEHQLSIFSGGEITDWGLMHANIPLYHENGIMGQGVTVAVLDTGVSPHTDLDDNVVQRLDSVQSDGIDRQGHGTHVAGIIGAVKNGAGIVGVAPSCKLICIKVLGDNGHGGYASIEEGIQKAMDAGAHIINMSLGASVPPPDSLHQKIKEAAQRGIIIVAAAGNDSGAVNYPAKYPEIIAVGAIDERGNLADFSSHGPEISVVAPGVNIYSTYLNNQFAVLRGTSQASPFIAGICALLLSQDMQNNNGQRTILSIQGMLDALDEICDPKDSPETDGKIEGNDTGLGIPKMKLFKNI